MKIIRLDIFNKKYNKLDYSIKNLVDKQINILVETQGKGKNLDGNILFERKIKGYRLLYFKSLEENLILVLITIINKKQQQKTINWIKKTFQKYF